MQHLAGHRPSSMDDFIGPSPTLREQYTKVPAHRLRGPRREGKVWAEPTALLNYKGILIGRAVPGPSTRRPPWSAKSGSTDNASPSR